MTCRVHYINPEGRPAWKDIVATREEASAVFAHLFPGAGRVRRVEIVGTVTTPRAATPQPAVDRRPASDAQLRAVAAGLRAFRQRLAAS